MKEICVIGVGYVGLVTAACFADLGNRVIALDISAEKIQKLESGIMPIYEPGLKEMVQRNMHTGRLRFTQSYPEALEGTEFAFIAVGTPSGVDGETASRHAPRHRRWCYALAWLTSSLLPAQPRLSQLRQTHRRTTRRAIQRSSRPRHVARGQRIRLSRQRVFLRQLHICISHVAQRKIWHA